MHYCYYYLHFTYCTLTDFIKYQKNRNKINEYNKNVSHVRSNVITFYGYKSTEV